MNAKFRLLASVIAVLAILLGLPGPVLASDSSLLLYPGGDSPDGLAAGQQTNTVFYDVTKTFSYSGGPVCLSSQQTQCTAPAIDDAVHVYVNGVDHYFESRTHDFGPVDFSSFLQNGSNQIHVQLVDLEGPSEGGSPLYLVSASGGGGTPALNLVGALVTPVQVEFDQPYTIQGVVSNPAGMDQSGMLDLTGSGASQTKNFVVSANGTKTVTFDSLKQRWDFIDPNEAAKCYSLSGFLKPTFEDIFLKDVGDLVGALENLLTLSSLQTRKEFTYTISLDGQNMQTSVFVVAPAHKLYQLLASMGLDFLWPKLVTIGIAGSLTGDLPALAILAAGSVAWQGSCDIKMNAADPDPNYQLIQEPIPLSLIEVSNLPGSPEKQADLDFLKWLSDVRALNTTLARYEGAKEAGDYYWAKIQLSKSRVYSNALLYDLYALNRSYDKAFGNLQVTSQDVAQSKQWFATNGIPPELAAMMAELGSTQDEINHFTDTYLNYVDIANTNGPSTTNIVPYLVPVYENLVDYQDSQIQILSGDPNLDIVPPQTSIQLDGTFGLNNWFISNVTITLTSADNPGGSGVQKIEWSIDDGRSWNTYTGPFVFTQEGVIHLIARATDNQGNIEYPPAMADFKVDKTPPMVTVTTDQTDYTRVQPFIVHFSGYDPMPGSGLASLTATFNGQSVTDGQSVDMFWWPLGQYTLTVTGVDNAGWVTTKSVTINLIATIQSLQGTVNRLCAENYITNHGICNSLLQKLDAALAAQNRGQPATAVNILNAFENEVKAQSGKAIKTQAAQLLLADSDYVISTLGGKK